MKVNDEDDDVGRRLRTFASRWYERTSSTMIFVEALTIIGAGTISAYTIMKRRKRNALYATVRPLFIDFSKPIRFDPIPSRPSPLSLLRGSDRGLSYVDIHRAVEYASSDPKVPGLVVRVGRQMNLTWAQIEEFRYAIKEYKNKCPEKPVVCVAESIDHIGALVLATAGTRVTVQPSGSVNVGGLATGSLFFKNALDRMGISAQIERREEYKNALDFLTNEKYSEPQREQIETLLTEIDEKARTMIVEDRGLDPTVVCELQSTGPIDPARAIEVGIIDETAYMQDFVLDRVGDLGRVETDDSIADDDETVALETMYGAVPPRVVESEDTKRQMQRSGSTRVDLKYPKSQRTNVAPVWTVGGYVRKWDDLRVRKAFAKGKKNNGVVAYLHACGQIRSGRKGVGRNGIAAENLVADLERALADERVVGVALRIDSPGGDPVACDTITRSIQRLQAAGKPVVAAMSSVAASGGT